MSVEQGEREDFPWMTLHHPIRLCIFEGGVVPRPGEV
jgi:hypothetical protein